VARPFIRVLGECRYGGDELPVREWLVVHLGGDAGGATAKGGVMLTVAYLANQFPSQVEPYVFHEIEQLRSRGVRVIAGSVRSPQPGESSSIRCEADVILQRLSAMILLRAFWFCLRRWHEVLPVIGRVLLRGREGPLKRIKALVHTCIGACYAVMLQEQRVDHIHVHHGYFGSWIAMVAARLLGASFSMTLHGSDLLLHATYLDVKLERCSFCATVSEYNRRYIQQKYPRVDAEKLLVARLGVEVTEPVAFSGSRSKTDDALTLLAVGRLHSVKDHAFLVRACSHLLDRNVNFKCSIAGDGPERHSLRALIRELGLDTRITLLGHVARENMATFYDQADVVVLTSRSEGVPLVLMEAMARGRIVLAPAITGIPELVVAAKTGFLYESGSLDDFVSRLLFIRTLLQAPATPELRPYVLSAARQLNAIRQAAREQVFLNFNRSKNLESFGDVFLRRVAPQTESIPHEDFVLQQI
jgi:glycosyltransferase involved in cell wall biosynthesis